MSEGNKKVDLIMAKLDEHILGGACRKTNRQHYNFVYEAIWNLITEKEQLQAENDKLKVALTKISCWLPNQNMYVTSQWPQEIAKEALKGKK